MEEQMTKASRTTDEVARHNDPLPLPGIATVTIVDGTEQRRSHRSQDHPHGVDGAEHQLLHGHSERVDIHDMEDTPPNCADPHITYLSPGRHDPPRAVPFIGPLHNHEGQVILSEEDGDCPEDDEWPEDNRGRRSHEDRIISKEMDSEPHDLRHLQRNPVTSQAEWIARHRRLMEQRNAKTTPSQADISRLSAWARTDNLDSPRNTGTKRHRGEVDNEVDEVDTWATGTVGWNEEPPGHCEVHPLRDPEGTWPPSTSTMERAITVVCRTIPLIDWNEIAAGNNHGRPSEATQAFEALVDDSGIPLAEWAQLVVLQRQHDLKQQRLRDRESDFPPQGPH
jgi:hypothetical protein